MNMMVGLLLNKWRREGVEITCDHCEQSHLLRDWTMGVPKAFVIDPPEDCPVPMAYSRCPSTEKPIVLWGAE